MALATPQLLEAISDLTTIQEMKVAVNTSLQCGTITCLSTIAGGLLGGPAGIALGGLLGTALASFHANGKFKSVPEILNQEATPEQKEKLARAIRDILKAENITILLNLAITLQANDALRDKILRTVLEFLNNDMGYRCVT